MFDNFEKLVRVIESLGGTPFLVGGAIRDEIIGRENHDRDIVVTGITTETLLELGLVPTGNLFPVFRATLASGEEIEIALARSEKKVGEGHTGFLMNTAGVSIEEDLLRRDLTINAIARNLITGAIVDPFGGQEDIRNCILRAVSPAFSEDPLRSLRVARFAAQLGFAPTPETLRLMKGTEPELVKVPHERIGGELMKALTSSHPGQFFRVLADADLLTAIFPDVAALIGKTQPVKWHPEGDAFEHTMLVLDAVKPDLMVRFGALCHDLGKGTTPVEKLPKHIGHDRAGVTVIQEWRERTSSKLVPVKMFEFAEEVAKLHMSLPVMRKAGKLVDIIMSLNKNGMLKDMIDIVSVDRGGDIPKWMTDIDIVIRDLHSVTGADAIAAGVAPGPAVGVWLTNKRAAILKSHL